MDYTIRRSPRARRVRVSVHGSGEIEVVLPRRAPERAAAQAVRELESWIERRRRTLARAAAEVARPEGTVPSSAATCGSCPSRAASASTAAATSCWCQPATTPARRSERWYRRQARAEIGARLDAATARTGTAYAGLTIRGQKTRWASCSSRGHMSFNWRLLLAPEAVLDYVVEHEVAHLELMDHSPRFWALLESRVPTGASTRAGCAATARRCACRPGRSRAARRRRGTTPRRRGWCRSSSNRPM